MHPCSGLDLEVRLQGMMGCSPCCPISGGSAKSWGPLWWGVLVFLPARNWIEPNHPSDATALAAKRLGWIQHVVMEEKSGSDFKVKPAARNRGLLRQVSSSEGVKWQGTGWWPCGMKSCSKAFGEINTILFLMTVAYYIVLPLFVLIGSIRQTCSHGCVPEASISPVLSEGWW